MPHDEERTSQVKFEPLLRRGGWIKLTYADQYPEPRFPFVCVSCLAPTQQRECLFTSRDEGWHAPVRHSLVVGLCPDCKRYWNRQSNRFGMIALLPIVALSLAIGLITWHAKAGWEWALMMAIAPWGLLLLPLILFSQMLGPVQRHPLSWLPGGVFIRFRNAAFAEMYRRQKSDGV